MRFWSPPRDILNKDVPRREPRRPSGRAIVNKPSPLYVSILSLAFNRLPRNGLDGNTRIGHPGSTQKQAFGSCANHNTPIGPPNHPDFDIPRRRFHFLRSNLHPDPASSVSHVDDAQESLRALQESADALPNPHLKSAISGVSALWQIEKRVKQSKREAQAWSQRSLNVLETLAEAVGQDPFNIPPVMLRDIRSFVELLLEIRTAMEPLIEQDRTRRFRSNYREKGFNDFDRRLSDLQQKFEEACSQRSGLDTPFVSTATSRVPPDPLAFRRRCPFSGLKSRLDPVSSTSADVARTTLRVLEKLAGTVPIVSGAVSGISALLDTAERVKQSRERAQALSQHSATLAEAVDHDQSDMPPLMLESVLIYKDQLSEVRAAMVPITERGWISRFFRLNRIEDILDTSNRRLNEAQQHLMVGTATQTSSRVEVSQFQKHTTDSLNILYYHLLFSNVLLF